MLNYFLTSTWNPLKFSAADSKVTNSVTTTFKEVRPELSSLKCVCQYLSEPINILKRIV